MLRASGFALGLFITLWGGLFLSIDKIVLHKTDDYDDRMSIRGMLSSPEVLNTESRAVVDPPDWAAFGLMSLGSVIILYSVALPKHN